MERGSLAADRTMLALINRMDSSSKEMFAAIVARSFKLAQKHPDYRVPRIDRNETSDFLRAAGTVLEEPEKTRYFATMRALSAASDSDVCWWGRMLNRYALNQEAEARTNAVRFLTLLGAQEPEPLRP